MIELAQGQFDIFALSLPTGLAFGNDRPQGTWLSEDSATCGVLTQNVANRTFGVLSMRRREDGVWTVTLRQLGIMNENVISGLPKEVLPPGEPRRTPLWDLERVTPSKIFASLTRPTHHIAAWVLNQLYLALPKPNVNWARDYQTGNFHTRLWEAHLLACFLRVTQDHVSPVFPLNVLSDLHLQQKLGDASFKEWILRNTGPESLTQIGPRCFAWFVPASRTGPVSAQLQKFGLTVASDPHRRS